MSLRSAMEAARSRMIWEEGGAGFHCLKLTARYMGEDSRLMEEAKDYRPNVERILKGTTKENPMSVSDIADKSESWNPFRQYSDSERVDIARYAAMGLVTDEVAGMVMGDNGFSYFLK